MSNHLLEKLESKIDEILETLEILRLQVEELEEKNAVLVTENGHFKSRQSQWEQGLTTLLNKLDDVSPELSKSEFENEEVESLREFEEVV